MHRAKFGWLNRDSRHRNVSLRQVLLENHIHADIVVGHPADELRMHTAHLNQPVAVRPIPYARDQVRAPASCRLFQPVDDLLGMLGILAGQGTQHDDPLHRLGHGQSRPGQGHVRLHDAMIQKPVDKHMVRCPARVFQITIRRRGDLRPFLRKRLCAGCVCHLHR